MRCEVCGRRIHGKPYKVMIERARLTVCGKCARHGTIVWEETKPKTTTLKPRVSTPSPLKTRNKKPPPQVAVESTAELVENFDIKIRQGREKLGFSHEELGRKISEKVSLLKKIETGKMTPDNKLATKLEHTLKIKLLVPASKEKIPQTKISKTISRELTLGDFIQFDKKKVEEKR